jgi:hypothetical protein
MLCVPTFVGHLLACRKGRATFPGANMAEMLTCKMNEPGLLALHNSVLDGFAARYDSQFVAARATSHLMTQPDGAKLSIGCRPQSDRELTSYLITRWRDLSPPHHPELEDIRQSASMREFKAPSIVRIQKRKTNCPAGFQGRRAALTSAGVTASR